MHAQTPNPRPAYGRRLAPIEALRFLVGSSRAYTVREAGNAEDVRAAQALRFAVFNLELNEGLEHSFVTGLDADPFDEVCDHLLVEHAPTNEVVGTYRLQTGRSAARNLGYYSAQEFDFAPFEPMRGEIIELGRACVHRLHRNMVVLSLLWKGIAEYAKICGPPAIDQTFKTIDFLTWLDLHSLPGGVRSRDTI